MMTQENKLLLLQDLCARFSYGVMCQFTWRYYNETTPPEGAIAKHTDKIKYININTQEVLCEYYDEWVDIENCKPYLRPMSSMTIDESYELDHVEERYNNHYDSIIAQIDWLNAHHFDYRNLIEKGLALEAKNEMYK